MIENLTAKSLNTIVSIVCKEKEGDDHDDIIGTVEVETHKSETKFKLKILHEKETVGSFSKDDTENYFFCIFQSNKFIGKISFVFYGKSYHKGWISDLAKAYL